MKLITVTADKKNKTFRVNPANIETLTRERTGIGLSGPEQTVITMVSGERLYCQETPDLIQNMIDADGAFAR